MSSLGTHFIAFSCSFILFLRILSFIHLSISNFVARLFLFFDDAFLSLCPNYTLFVRAVTAFTFCLPDLGFLVKLVQYLAFIYRLLGDDFSCDFTTLLRSFSASQERRCFCSTLADALRLQDNFDPSKITLSRLAFWPALASLGGPYVC